MSLVRLMRALVEHGWDVELVLSTAGGALEPRVDSRIRINHLRDRIFGQRFLMERRFWFKALWLVLDGFPFLYSRFQWTARALSYRFKYFDVAAISLHGLSPSFCCNFVRADRRLHWIRNDLAKCDPDEKVISNIQHYKNDIDAFICVSSTARKSLLREFPDLDSKTWVMHNIIDANDMVARSSIGGDPYDRYGEVLKVVTVCRLSDQSKGLFRMLDVHRKLRSAGIDFRWFVIGDGLDRKKLEQATREYGMEEHFILMGRKDNPFPYYRYADVSATLSYYEGLCGSVNEAKVLGLPVIATRFSGVEEQLINGVNGLIVENHEHAILEGMKRLLSDGDLRSQLSNDVLPEPIRDDAQKIRLFERLAILES